ncbi:MAG TPA: 2Fe-2S iron-sulfur cluster-binding protein [Pseudolabrys sp.]|nr:2Fe-2S iron-sulfur cluster-binding protein [Pseudolabrys sp.]
MNTVSLTINGRSVSADVEPRTHLADFIRETQTLTGTHLGCEHGVCGACTVLVDGMPIRSCITYAVACEGASVTTVEGLDDDEIGKELRAAFSREHALQCGYCTPGMLVSARDVVLRAHQPSEHDIRVAMSGNLCRCTGYLGIIRAIQGVIADRRARGIEALPGAGRAALGPAGSGLGKPAVVNVSGRRISNAVSQAGSHASAEVVGDWKPQAGFEQSFVVNHAIDKVWDFFCDTAAVASCLPGASVAGDTSARSVNGKMRIKVGPIAAEFRGAALIERDANTHSGVIEGSGRDQGSSSATRGVIRFRLAPQGKDATRVDLDVGYRLTGPLAQFSRSDLVHDIASRIIAAFAQNVDARLSGEAIGSSELNAGSLFFRVLINRIKQTLRRLTGRSQA